MPVLAQAEGRNPRFQRRSGLPRPVLKSRISPSIGPGPGFSAGSLFFDESRLCRSSSKSAAPALGLDQDRHFYADRRRKMAARRSALKGASTGLSLDQGRHFWGQFRLANMTMFAKQNRPQKCRPCPRSWTIVKNRGPALENPKSRL